MTTQNMLENKWVLIVDNEALIAFDLERVALEAGARGCVFARSAETLALLGESGTQFDFIIADLSSFEKDQIEMAFDLSEKTPILGLATTRQNLPKRPRNGGFVVVEKPFSDDDLIEAFEILCQPH